MARVPKTVDISNVPELLRIVEEVNTTREPRLLRRGGEDVAILMPTPPVKRRAPRGRAFTKEDSLWSIAGIGRSGLTDVSENKYKYLAAISPSTAYVS